MNKKYVYILTAIILFIVASFAVRKVDLRYGVDQNSASTSTNSETISNIDFKDYGPAPEFKLGDNWLNSKPLTLESLKGKVVLVDFWTYSCINCIRTMPYVTKWYDTYKDNGLVIIGVHTPEFAFELDKNNVQNAMSQFGIHYPVVQDNDYAIWNSYSNHYWPAEYLIDQKGEIVYEHFGEGHYDTTEKAIQQLLGISTSTMVASSSPDLSGIGSPEMYFGTWRLENLSSSQKVSLSAKDYTLNQNLDLNTFSLGGKWQFSQYYLTFVGSTGQMNLKFHSGKVFMVASSKTPATLMITVDGKPQPSVTVQDSKLYTLFDSNDYSDHVIEINVDQSGLEAFTFTFG